MSVLAVTAVVVAATMIAPDDAYAASPSVTFSPDPAPINSAVSFHGSGFAPGEFVLFKPCDVTGPSGFVCIDSPPYQFGPTADASGSFDFTFGALYQLCGLSACRYTFAGAAAIVVVTVPVFDPWTGAARLRQRIPYSGGQTVDLDGTGWTANTIFGVDQCSARGCVDVGLTSGTAVFGSTDGSGRLTTKLKLKRTVRQVDCYAAPCWLRVAEWPDGSFPTPPPRIVTLALVMGPPGSTVAVGYFNTGREGDAFACAPVILTKAAAKAVTVSFHTSDIDATAGADYVAVTNGVVTIPAGQFVGCAKIDLIDDRLSESTEMIGVQLDAASGAMLIEGGRGAYVFLSDND
jgi:hypothetical protein